MFKPEFHNEQGVTLVELLAALALLSMVIALAGSLIMSVGNNQQTASNAITLQQNTNVLLSEMEHAYHERSGKGDLPFHIDNDKLRIHKLVINDDEKSKKPPIKNINFDESLDLKLETRADNHKTVAVTTTWQPKESKHIALKKPVTPPTPPDPDDKYDDWKTVDKLPCKSDKNIKWTGEGYESCDSDSYNLEGALWVTDEMETDETYKIDVNKDFWSDEEVDLDEDNQLRIGGNAVFNNALETEENTMIEVGGNAKFNNDTEIEENNKLTIGGNAGFSGEFESDNDSLIDIGGNVKFGNDTDIDDNDLTIGGDADFSGEFEAGENASINIGGNAIFNNDMSLNEEAVLELKGSGMWYDAFELDDGASLTVNKDAEFKGDIDDLDGDLCIKGTIKSKSEKISSQNDCS